MGEITKAFRHSSFYFISHILVVMGGFISMPLFTRMLTVTEYGLYTSIGVTLYFLLAFSKLGIQQAALRFYSDYKGDKSSKNISTYFSTMILGVAILNIPVNFTVLVISYFVLYRHEATLSFLIFSLIFVIVVMDSIHSVMMQILIAQEKSISYSVISIIKRYGYIVLAFIFSLFFTNKLYGIYWGCLISNGILFLYLFLRWTLQRKISLWNISLSLLKESIKYGFPLIFLEISTIILCMGDRYIIQYYMGVESVGIYSVGYTIADMCQSILAFPLRLAVIPIYLRIWNEEGAEKTKHFLSQIFNYYIMFGIPIIIGVGWFGEEIVTLLATSKFDSAGIIIPYIIFPLIIYGALPIYGAAFYIYKRSDILMYITLISAILNIILNIVLIPTWGILGAAIATLLAYLILFTVALLSSYKYIHLTLNFWQIVKYMGTSVVSIVIVSKVPIITNFILIKIGVVVILYCTVILIIDKNIRYKALLYMTK